MTPNAYFVGLSVQNNTRACAPEYTRIRGLPRAVTQQLLWLFSIFWWEEAPNSDPFLLMGNMKFRLR